MAGLILLGLLALGVIVVVVMVITKQSNKRILQALGGSFVVIATFMLYTNHTCGPNSTDVKIMTPQAEAISNYILKNGIPESLSEISGLPYELEGCKWANDGTKIERCNFTVNSNIYSIHLDYLFNILEIYTKTSETGIYINFKNQGNNIFIIEKSITSYSSKHDGICNPMRM
ncbi:hypothetical protein [Sulfurimonas sp.]|uniref:hypothetical protein n=1 Tax=Sulfurimonas sp. TaxID=2022749 RepID=UPI003D0F72AE